jgi:hypothetical protein
MRTLSRLSRWLLIGAIACAGGLETGCDTGCTSPASPRPDGNPTHEGGSSGQSGSSGDADGAAQADPAGEKFEGTAGITEQARKGPPALLSAVRTATHQNFDRVVFEFKGDTVPGYHIEYIDKPVRKCGSGETTQLAGFGWLLIRMSPAQAHGEDGKVTVQDQALAPGLPIMKELKQTCDFEGQVSWVIGVGSPNRYRVLELSNPTRLVVDIKK